MYQTKQNGNVLFLILIAVALFAALSYAVTQSTRTGGNSDRETTLLNSAQLTAYPNSIKTAVLRMIIDGAQISNLEFNDPATISTTRNSIFHPDGGGAVYQDAPADLMANASAGTWYFNMEFEVDQVGLTPADDTEIGNDLVAFLPGVTLNVCQRINLEAEVTTSLSSSPPSLAGTLAGGSTGNYDYNMDTATYTYGAISRDVTLDTSGNELEGHSFGCFNDGGTYVYYHVINER